MNKLHITRKQWLFFLRWATYSALFFVTLVLQGTILSRFTIFGVRLNLLPPCIVCVAMQEGQERGGVFALCASVFWALSGGDFGYISVVSWTFCAIICAWLCRAFFYHTLLSCVVCSLGTLLLTESCIFLLRALLGSVLLIQFFAVLLPSVLLSLLGCPAFYYLVHFIARIGE